MLPEHASTKRRPGARRALVLSSAVIGAVLGPMSGAILGGDAARAADPMVVTGTTNPTTMTSALIARGIHVVSATYDAGAPGWYSLFPFSAHATDSYAGITVSGKYTSGPLGIADGLLMTNGEATLAVPPNRSLPYTLDSFGHPIKEGATGVLSPDIGPPVGQAGEQEAFCASLIGDPSINPHDVVKLTIDFTLDPGFDGIQLDYIFGSEEFPEYRGATYPDAFGFFVRPAGSSQFTNFARDPSGANININGPFFASDEVIKTYGDGAPQLSEYNGLTPRLRSSFPLASGADKVHRIVIVICDAGDQYLDSGVWLSALAGCSGTCEDTTWCGNGKVEAGEECDDGNNHDGDGCSIACRIEAGYACLNQTLAPSVCVTGCGNGVVAGPYEQCDDQNLSNHDDCTNGCRTATCSDGYLHDAGSGTETGVDCGGTCPACLNGYGCKVPADCVSGYCDQALKTCGTPPAPNAVDDTWNVLSGAPSVLAAGALQGNDQYVSAQTFSLLTSLTTANGTISYSTSSGLLTYTPPAGFGGQDSFIYSICSPYSGSVCDTAVVRIHVNRAPVIVDKTQWVAVGTPSVTLVPSAVYTDADVDPINNAKTLASVRDGATAVVQADGSVLLTPSNPTVGATWVVTLTMCDSADPFGCDTGTWTVVYNDPPVLADVDVKLAGGESATVSRNAYLMNFGAIRGDDPSDGDIDGLTATYVATAANGTFGTAKSLGIATCAVDTTTGAVTLVAVQGLSGTAPCFVKVCEELPANDSRVCALAAINVSVVECTSDAACTGGVCNPATNHCAPCLNSSTGAATDVGCSAQAPFCEVVSGAFACVACADNPTSGAVDIGCNSSLPICELGAAPRVCVQCDHDSDCANGAVCDPQQHACVACLNTQASGAVDAGCSSDRPACAVAGVGNLCVECLADADCRDGKVCNPGLRACVACRDTSPAGGIDLGCRLTAPVCKGAGEQAACVTCIDDHTTGVDSGCTSNSPTCDTSDPQNPSCLGCVYSTDCINGQVCDPNLHLCVICQDTQTGGKRDDGCPEAKPICAMDQHPVQCLACLDDKPPGEVDSGCSAIAPACNTTAIGGPRCIGCDGSAPCPNGGVCDPLTGGCVPCLDDQAGGGRDQGCSVQSPICDTVANPRICVACIDSVAEGAVDYGCSPNAPSCKKDAAGGPMCVPCTGSGDCGPDEVCATGINECVPVDECTAVDDFYQTNEGEPLVATAGEHGNGLMQNDVTPKGLNAWVELIETTRPPAAQGRVDLAESGAFTFTPAANFRGVVTFGYDLKATGKAPRRGDVTIRVNGRPVAQPDHIVTTIGDSVTIDVLANDSDPEGDVLHIGQVGGSQYGIFTGVDADNRIIYTPDGQFRGVDTFDYTVCDVFNACAGSTVTVTVGEVAGASAIGDVAATEEDTTIRINVKVNDDPRMALKGVQTQPRHGVAKLEDDGTVSYAPSPNWNGLDFFRYQTCLPGGACSAPWVRLEVAPVNDGPVAQDDAVTTARDVFVDLPVLDNDYDLDGDTLASPTVATVPQDGTATPQGPTHIRYTPHQGFEGIDVFTYQICDASNLCAKAKVVIKVGGATASNHVPVLADDSATTAEGAQQIVAVLDNDFDPDPGDTKFVSGVCKPLHGVAYSGAGGGVYYVPDPYFVGSDRFCYMVCDTAGGCASAFVTMTVTPGPNEPPVGVDDFVGTPVGIAAPFRPLDNDIDPDGDVLEILEISEPLHGTIAQHADGSVTYTPGLGFVGDDAVDVKISDGHGNSDTERVEIRVSASFNRPPEAVDDNYIVSWIQSTALPVRGNDSDLDGDAFFIASFTEPSDGLVSLAEDGNLTYKPRALLGGTGGSQVPVGGTLGLHYELVDARGARDLANVSLLLSDRDLDGIPDDIEEEMGTDPDDPDTDHDHIKDGDEVKGGVDPLRYDPGVDTNPLDADTDDDGLNDGVELNDSHTNPLVADTDEDGLWDGLELGIIKPVLPGVSIAGIPYAGTNLDVWEPDLDPDSKTDPLDDDSDDDSIIDGHEDANHNGRVDNEIGQTGTSGSGDTDPNDPDTDHDGIQDGTEKGNIAAEGRDTDPAVFIADADPLTVTNPLDWDTDDGSISDGDEDTNKNGRIDDGERNPNIGSDDVRGQGPHTDTFGVEGGGCAAGPDWTLVGIAALGLQRFLRRRPPTR